MTRLYVWSTLVSLVFAASSASAQSTGTPPKDARQTSTRLEFRVSPVIDMYYYVRTVAAETSRRQPDEAFIPAVEAGRKLGLELGDSLFGWGVVEGSLYGCDSMKDLVESFAQLPEKYTPPSEPGKGGGSSKEVELRAGASALAEALATAEDYFQKSIWPEHERLILEVQRRILEALAPKEADCVSYLLQHLGPQDPKVSVPIYLVANMPFPGAETNIRPDGAAVCFVAVRGQDPLQLIETILHESTHALDVVWARGTVLDQLRRLLEEAGDTVRKEDLRYVPHTLMFVHAGETVRRLLDAKHRHYGDVSGYYQKVPRAAEAVRQPWIDYLDGKTTRDAALLRIVNTLEASNQP